MTTAEILRAAKAKIANRARWAKGDLARAVDGTPVEPDDPKAVRWCAAGAIYAVCEDVGLARAVIDELAATIGDEDFAVSDFNDSHSHAEVLALLDEALAAVEGGR